MITPSKEVWDFVEQHLPDYYTNPDVLRQSELQLFIDGQDSTITGMTVDEAEDELHLILYNLYSQAIKASRQNIAKIDNILQEYLTNDNCMSEFLASVSADGLTIEEAFEFYISARKKADGDRFFIDRGEDKLIEL